MFVATTFEMMVLVPVTLTVIVVVGVASVICDRIRDVLRTWEQPYCGSCCPKAGTCTAVTNYPTARTGIGWY